MTELERQEKSIWSCIQVGVQGITMEKGRNERRKRVDHKKVSTHQKLTNAQIFGFQNLKKIDFGYILCRNRPIQVKKVGVYNCTLYHQLNCV